MRTRMLAAACVFMVACAGSEPQPTLSISPSGAQTISAPVLITASPPQLANDVAWSLSGPGALSGTSGGQVTYRPPVPAMLEPLAALLGVGAAELVEELERLCERRILRVDGPAFRFRYGLVRDVLRATLSPARERLLREQLHPAATALTTPAFDATMQSVRG